MTLTIAEKAEALAPWYQEVTWPDGSVSGSWRSEDKFRSLIGDYDLQGKTAFDVGCMSGVHTLCMERRGAEVVACDIIERNAAQFAFLKDTFDLKAEYVHKSVYRLDHLGQADVVWMTGVYYHLRHPLLGIEKAWECCKELLVIEGEVMEGDGLVASFWPGEYKGDKSNWWVPTRACLQAWLEGLEGVGGVEMVAQESEARAGARVWR
jgi:tRNA (mo5U34)-methyltransferase